MGVPNWMRVSFRLGQATRVLRWRLRTYKAELLDQLVVLGRLKIGLLKRQRVGASTRDRGSRSRRLDSGGRAVEVTVVHLAVGVYLESAAVTKCRLGSGKSSRQGGTEVVARGKSLSDLWTR